MIQLTPKQREAHQALQTHDFVLYGGAIRGGKTYWLIIELIGLCFKYPNSRWLILRESMTTLRRTTLVSWKQFLDKGLDQYIKSYNQTTQTVTFINGSEIIFMAEAYDEDKDLNRFRGLEINGAGLEEVNEIHKETFTKIIERAGSWNGSPGCPIKILATANPSNNWVKADIYDKWMDGTLNPRWAYIQAKISDNPHLTKEYIASLKSSLTKFHYMVFVEGLWDTQLKTGGEFYKSFELDQHVCETKYNPSLPLHISFDENVNPYFPAGIFQIEGKTIRMIDEIAARSPNNKVEWICREIERKCRDWGHTGGMFIYGDATSQKDDVKQQKGHNLFRLITQGLESFHPALRVTASNPSVVMRGMFINTVLEKNYEGIKVEIGENCKTTITDFMNVKEASDGTKHKEKETDATTKVSYQKYGHFTDLFDYLICSAFSKEYAKYQTGNKELVFRGGANYDTSAF